MTGIARIERSALVHYVDISDNADIDAPAQRLGVSHEEARATPFLLVGSVEQLIDELERRREALGISLYVVRHPAAFAPVAERLSSR